MSDDILDHIPALRAYSRILCRRIPDAEDLVQQTLLLGIEKAALYRPGTNMRAWLFTIMRNRFLNDCCKSARERTGASDCVSTIPVTQPSQEWHMRVVELCRRLHQMPQQNREAIIMVAAIGLSYDEAAQVMHCDIGTIKSRVHRARAILKGGDASS